MALPVCAQLSYSFVRGAAVRLGVSAYQQPVFTPGEAPLRRVDDDVGLSGPAASEWPVLAENGRVAGSFRTGEDAAPCGPTATEEAVWAARLHPR